MSIYINCVLTRLITGNNQPIFLPKNTELALTQVIRNKSDVDSKFTTRILKMNYKVEIIFIRLLKLCLERLRKRFLKINRRMQSPRKRLLICYLSCNRKMRFALKENGKNILVTLSTKGHIKELGQ